MIARLLRRPYPTRSDRPLVLAHRGASHDAPENTLAAFREAVRQGADGVELDAMVCGTGEVVVCHDEWLDRLAGEHLEVAKTSFSTLRRLDVGRRFGEACRGEAIPTLVEVLAAVPHGLVVNVELKSATLADRGLSRRAVRDIRREEGGHPILLSSFNPLSLMRARVLEPRLSTAMLIASSQDPLLRLWAGRAMAVSALHVEHLSCTSANVDEWHRLGLAIAAWTVDAAADVERCCEARVDAVITNRPATTLALVRRFARPRRL
jgi:glycerophosphoryl diester phosphodiesterase